MPLARFLPRLQSSKLPRLATIVMLHKEFDASLESTAIQAMRHDSRVVVIAKRNADSLAWHRISEPFFRATGYRQFRLRDKHTLPSDCATVAAFADSETQFDSTIREAVVTAAFCFGHVEAGGKRDILLREEAMRNGRFGVVSVLSLLNEATTKPFR